MTTPYHAKYYAYELTHKGGNGVSRISRTLFDACLDLNPHQIEAALFALRSPISKGALLADEVGLGKTIEAGLVIYQSWAEQEHSRHNMPRVTPIGDLGRSGLFFCFNESPISLINVTCF